MKFPRFLVPFTVEYQYELQKLELTKKIDEMLASLTKDGKRIESLKVTFPSDVEVA